jgi:hypothetical protein
LEEIMNETLLKFKAFAFMCFLYFSSVVSKQ